MIIKYRRYNILCPIYDASHSGFSIQFGVEPCRPRFDFVFNFCARIKYLNISEVKTMSEAKKTIQCGLHKTWIYSKSDKSSIANVPHMSKNIFK